MTGDQNNVRKRLDRLMAEREAEAARGQAEKPQVPNILEFVSSPEYLDLPGLFPAQGTLLKIATLRDDLFTDFDREVIATLEAGFVPGVVDGELELVGERGLAPGTVERMTACRESGRLWFREMVFVVGRRGGKSYLAALLSAYVLWNLIALDDPQKHFGIAKAKQLLTMVIATNKEQASRDLYRDLVTIILEAPCFQPYIGRRGASVRLRTPVDVRERPSGQGSLLVQAQATTATAGRGPAAMVLLFDEVAHARDDGMVNGADEVYRAAAPALAQFPNHSLTIMASSPASQTGEFYAAYRHAMAIDEDAQPIDATSIAVVLRSWDPYYGWERAHEISMWPGGPCYEAKAGPVISPDSPTVVAERRHNPHRYMVEYEARWRASQFSFFDPEAVRDMFTGYNGVELPMQTVGDRDVNYAMHLDPSHRRANYGIAIGHLEGDRTTGHIVFDFLKAFEPSQFDSGEIDTRFMLDYTWQLIQQFWPRIVTYDPFDSHYAVDILRDRVREAGMAHRVLIDIRPHTESSNYLDAERFGILLSERRIHAPRHTQTRDELLFMEEKKGKIDHPTTGPVITSDMADCVFAVTDHLMDGDEETFKALSQTRVTGADVFTNRSPFFDDYYRQSRYTNPGGYNPARGDRRPGGRGTHGPYRP